MNATRRRTRHDFLYADTNKDGKLMLAEYLAELLPEAFNGNETAAELDASPVWKDAENDWVLNSKVRRGCCTACVLHWLVARATSGMWCGCGPPLGGIAAAASHADIYCAAKALE
jgi:hypothetical protein